MNTLIKADFSPFVLLILALIIRISFPSISWLSFLAVILSLHQFLLLFNSIGNCIPIRYLFGSLICLQMFIGPVFAYNGLDQFQYFVYKMQIPETAYFAYAIPAVMSFIVGLHIANEKLSGEIIDEERVKLFVEQNKNLPYIFIALGFISSIAAGFVSFELAYAVGIIGSFKYIGAFLLIIGSQKLKILPLVLIIASIVSSSLSNAMFHDLLIWVIFFGAVLAIKYKLKAGSKIFFCIVFIGISIVIHQLKGVYRTATWVEGKQPGFETFIEVYKNYDSKTGFFSFTNLAPSNVRINQGFIITYIMKTVPSIVPFSKGEELRQIIEAALLPRFLAPNKLSAGDRTIFTKHTGLALAEGTSMGLSALGDAYINFGLIGGCVFMFLLGLLYNGVLKIFDKYTLHFPILLLFTPLVFYYPIRPDCELQTALGQLVKSCFVIVLLFWSWSRLREHENQDLVLGKAKA